jgi:nucleoside-diphosphate-sugar epimerase
VRLKILIFGATGMVGQGVLRWLIASPQVSQVAAVSRRRLSMQHPKLETLLEADMFHLQHIDVLRDFDACFFCLGASSVGMSPEAYRRLTYDLTLTVARQLLPGNPRMVFEYISGEGTDATSRQSGHA